ncbi:MAG TPA: hypothetical protein PLG25_04540 [bacterium]|nr:hypothetical protein [bacterium]HMW34170.1 hypothetical protein [bacterium]HMW35679.1 hypothetical protein [bacterium]HMY36598.1 hypothetical protein [bacterium]HMZ04496.1 hypothetical protein [bacterium]
MIERSNFSKDKSIDLDQPESIIDWFWVFWGCVIGIVIIGAFTFITSTKYNPDVVKAVPMLIGGLAFAVTGMILGHYSPGHTVKEAAVAGLVIPIIGFVLSGMGYGPTFIAELSIFEKIGVALAGMLICQLGGWVGEELEGYDHPTKWLQWHWIIVAVVIGFMLNSFVIFFVGLISLTPVPVFMALSVFAAGIVAGYKSPGHTEKECSIAGALTILLDYLFITFALGIEAKDFGIESGTMAIIVLVALAVAGGLGLLGGWIGERMQIQEKELNN